MKKRKKLKQETNYFVSDDKPLEFISSGCQVLDCVLGGGYPLGRMTNVIGDKSTAKTHLACEATGNFLKTFPTGAARYVDAEHAFERDYAEAMGMPVDQVSFDDDEPVRTIEDLFKDLTSFLDTQQKSNEPGIYVLDSLDALSDDEELKRDFDKGSYAMNKQKKLGELFRRLKDRIELTRVNLFIISQIRENIGVMFGEKYKRAGGRAMDFYASQCLWLANTGKETQTRRKIKRIVGINVRAICKKNKIGLPYRQCDFPFIFGYGVDDLTANLNWLKEVKMLGEIDVSESGLKDYLKEVSELPTKEWKKERRRVSKAVKKAWAEVETEFLPTRSKYG